MKRTKLAETIRERFVELLATTREQTSSIIKLVALEFGVPQSVVTDAVTKASKQRKGPRK